MKFSTLDITTFEDFRIGNAEDRGRGTGCTVIISEKGAVGGVDVRGGGPATRETDILRSENTAEAINAVVLSGGSTLGLEAASGVTRELAEHGIGFRLGDAVIPLVCGASLFDLNIGNHKAFPDVAMGIEATRNAFSGRFRNGNSGAGTGASVGKILGIRRAMKSGLGTFACGDGELEVGAVVAVNAMGDVYNGAGNIIAGLRSEDGSSIYGTIRTFKGMVHHEKKKDPAEETAGMTDGDYIGSVSRVEHKEKMKEVARAIKEEFSRTNQYKKTEVPETDRKNREDREREEKLRIAEELRKAEELRIAEEHRQEIMKKEEAAAAAEEQSFIENAASGRHMRREEPEEEKAAEVPAFPETGGSREEFYEEKAADEGDLGYDIPFNTTIGCLVTNAKLTKAQANKLASILHDAYARSIKPVHGTLDGDTVFVLASGKQEVNFDAFAALATDVMQYAVIDAAMSAKTAYGLPAASDMANRRQDI